MPEQVSRTEPAAPGEEPRPSRVETLFASPSFQPFLYLVLFLICYLAYHGIFDNYLFNDDFSWLRESRDDMTWHNVLTFQVVQFFRPLVNLSFFVMQRLWPGNIPVEHAFSMLFHFLCTILVFHLIANLARSRFLAASAAILFAVTSVHTAAVFWISARTTLMSSFFLLAAFVMLTARGGRARVRIAWATVLYVLALASKEEAVAGMFLVLLLFFIERKRLSATNGAVVVSFAVVTAAYFAVRQSIIHGLFGVNWGPGWHALRNLGGGFLFQFYPWPLFSIFYSRGLTIAQPSSPYVPEILALPLAVILVWVGRALKKGAGMGLAVGWTALALLPVSPFRYRFFSTDSISQNRYYYLSSVGSTFAIAILLGALWNWRARLARPAAAALFIVICAGSILHIEGLERKWDDFTKMYREAVQAIVEESDRFSGLRTMAVEDSPLGFPYLADAVDLERPGWTVVKVTGGRAEAEKYAPCLYISYSGTKPKVMRVTKIEGGAAAQ